MLPSTFAGQVTTLAGHLFDVEFDNILSKRRDHTIVRARQAAMCALREVKGFSFPRIGRMFARDHSTVIHAWEKTQSLLISNPDFASRYQLLLRETENLNDSIVASMRKHSMLDVTRIKPRLTTLEVCDLAGYGPQTLMKRVREGRMPQPVDKARHHIFDRDAVLRALNLIERQEESQW